MEKRLCGIEQAYNQGQLIEKPVSCHLYPVRKDFTEFAANYDKWDICDPACSLGQELRFQFINLSKKLWLEGLAKTGT
jgi:hypothetical protein